MDGEGDITDGDIDDWTIIPEDGYIYNDSEVEPQFPGGTEAMMKWLSNEINYPELPREMGIGGTVYIEFVVNTDGSITNVKSVKSPHEDLSKEGIRVVKKMPKWSPGEQAGKKVRVRYHLPIKFVQIN